MEKNEWNYQIANDVTKKRTQDCLENPLGLVRDLIKVADYKTNKHKKQLAFLHTSNNLLENIIKKTDRIFNSNQNTKCIWIHFIKNVVTYMKKKYRS